MNLAEWLPRLSTAERVALATDTGVDPAADVQALAKALQRPDRIARTLAALAPAVRDALTLLILGFDDHADRNTLAHELGRLHPAAAGEALAALERAVLVVPRTVSPWSFVLVDDAAPVARAAVAAWLQEACDPWADQARALLPAGPAAALTDTVRLLGAMADGVRVRQEGGIFQVDQRRLAEVFDHSRPALWEPIFRGWADYASERLACHLALAMQLNLLEASPRGWQVAPEVAAWVELPPGRQWGELARAWRDLAGLRLGGRLNLLLAPFAGGRWVDFNRWRGHLARYVRSYPPLPAAVDAVFLRPGLMLGAIGAGRAGDRDVYRLTAPALAALEGGTPALAPPAERILVGADFEVVVPPGAPARAVWDLQRWARLVRADRVTRYRITRETVRHRSHAGGESAAAWLDSLGAEARFGIPDNVRAAVLEWALPARRASMRPAVALRFPEGVPEGWTAPPGAQAAGPRTWLLDLPAAVREAAALRRDGVVVEGAPEEWTAMERARQEHRRRTGPAPMSLPWPGPLAGDPRTAPWPEAGASEGP